MLFDVRINGQTLQPMSRTEIEKRARVWLRAGALVEVREAGSVPFVLLAQFLGAPASQGGGGATAAPTPSAAGRSYLVRVNGQMIGTLERTELERRAIRWKQVGGSVEVAESGNQIFQPLDSLLSNSPGLVPPQSIPSFSKSGPYEVHINGHAMGRMERSEIERRSRHWGKASVEVGDPASGAFISLTTFLSQPPPATHVAATPGASQVSISPACSTQPVSIPPGPYMVRINSQTVGPLERGDIERRVARWSNSQVEVAAVGSADYFPIATFLAAPRATPIQAQITVVPGPLNAQPVVFAPVPVWAHTTAFAAIAVAAFALLVAYCILPLARFGFSFKADPSNMAAALRQPSAIYSSSNWIFGIKDGHLVAGKLSPQLVRALPDAETYTLRDLPGLLPIALIGGLAIYAAYRSRRQIQDGQARQWLVVLIACAAMTICYLWLWTNAADHDLSPATAMGKMKMEMRGLGLMAWRRSLPWQIAAWTAGILLFTRFIYDIWYHRMMPLVTTAWYLVMVAAIFLMFRADPYFMYSPLSWWPLLFGLALLTAAFASIRLMFASGARGVA